MLTTPRHVSHAPFKLGHALPRFAAFSRRPRPLLAALYGCVSVLRPQPVALCGGHGRGRAGPVRKGRGGGGGGGGGGGRRSGRKRRGRGGRRGRKAGGRGGSRGLPRCRSPLRSPPEAGGPGGPVFVLPPPGFRPPPGAGAAAAARGTGQGLPAAPRRLRSAAAAAPGGAPGRGLRRGLGGISGQASGQTRGQNPARGPHGPPAPQPLPTPLLEHQVPARVPVASPERAPELRAPGAGSAPAGRGGPGQARGGVLRPPRPQRPPQNLRGPLETSAELGLHPKAHRGGDLGAQSSAPPGRAPPAAAGEDFWGREVRPPPPPPPQISNLGGPRCVGRSLRTPGPPPGHPQGPRKVLFFSLKLLLTFNKNNSSRSL